MLVIPVRSSSKTPRHTQYTRGQCWNFTYNYSKWLLGISDFIYKSSDDIYGKINYIVRLNFFKYLLPVSQRNENKTLWQNDVIDEMLKYDAK